MIWTAVKTNVTGGNEEIILLSKKTYEGEFNRKATKLGESDPELIEFLTEYFGEKEYRIKVKQPSCVT